MDTKGGRGSEMDLEIGTGIDNTILYINKIDN